jgi:hypothetical protein
MSFSVSKREDSEWLDAKVMSPDLLDIRNKDGSSHIKKKSSTIGAVTICF